jgi:hypothetical protein
MSYRKKINAIECGVINLEDCDKEGSHWAASYKNNDKKYFDSYRNAPPPKELVIYPGFKNLIYNKRRFQNYYDLLICGHLCIIVLKKQSKGENYEEILKQGKLKTEVTEIYKL